MARAILSISLLSSGTLLAIALPLLVLLRKPLVAIAFGADYRSAAGLVPALGVAMAFLALANLLTYFHIAMASRAYLAVIGGVVLEVALIARFHGSPREIAYVVVLTSAVVVCLQYLMALSVVRWRPELERSRELVTPLSREPELELSLVLPCHNAGSALKNVLDGLVEELRGEASYELIVVSDGSTDDTVRVAAGYEGTPVRVLEHPVRSGKGHALRVGLTEARGRYVAFLDADGDIAPATIGSFLALMRLYDPDVVLGSKRHPLSEVSYPPLRRLLSWTYHKTTRLLFRVNVRDTQTGVKLIRREVLSAVLPRLLEKRYAFDLEFLVVARSLGYRRIFEAPIRLEYRFASHVNLTESFRILWNTLAIFYRHYALDTYRQAGRQVRAKPIESAAVEEPLTVVEDRRGELSSAAAVHPYEA